MRKLPEWLTQPAANMFMSKEFDNIRVKLGEIKTASNGIWLADPKSENPLGFVGPHAPYWGDVAEFDKSKTVCRLFWADPDFSVFSCDLVWVWTNFVEFSNLEVNDLLDSSPKKKKAALSAAFFILRILKFEFRTRWYSRSDPRWSGQPGRFPEWTECSGKDKYRG